MSKPTERQAKILNYMKANGGQITTAQAVELLKHYYYANAAHYVGIIVARMIKQKMIVREKRGIFVFLETKKDFKTDDGQSSLFG